MSELKLTISPRLRKQICISSLRMLDAVSETNGLGCRSGLEGRDRWVADGLGDAVRKALVDSSEDRNCDG